MIRKQKVVPVKLRSPEVVHGHGMPTRELDALLKKSALRSFDAPGAVWIVIEDKALEDEHGGVEVKAFADKDTAVRYAQACSHGNVDHRVLLVTSQIFVVGSMNVTQVPKKKPRSRRSRS